jgi:hypothetical protein
VQQGGVGRGGGRAVASRCFRLGYGTVRGGRGGRAVALHFLSLGLGVARGGRSRRWSRRRPSPFLFGLWYSEGGLVEAVVAPSPLTFCLWVWVRQGEVGRGGGHAVAPCRFSLGCGTVRGGRSRQWSRRRPSLVVFWCGEGGSVEAMVALSPLAGCLTISCSAGWFVEVMVALSSPTFVGVGLLQPAVSLVSLVVPSLTSIHPDSLCGKLIPGSTVVAKCFLFILSTLPNCSSSIYLLRRLYGAMAIGLGTGKWCLRVSTGLLTSVLA